MLKIIDIKKGEMTFGQRILLGTILSNNKTSEYEKFCKCIELLYKKEPSKLSMKKWVNIFDGIIEGLVYWSELENKELEYELTDEQKRAGYGKPSKWSTLSTADTIAIKYKLDPDVVLDWKYSKVFGILAKDLDEHKKAEAYHKIISE